MHKLFFALFFMAVLFSCNPKIGDGLRKKDLKKDVEMVTDKGVMVIRLSDSTPLHRNNFLVLAKSGYYDSMLFQRVINHFMIQAGDLSLKAGKPVPPTGRKSLDYTIPAEIRSGLFHHKGVIAAPREPDNTNPQKESHGAGFYIVQGHTFTPETLAAAEKRAGRSITAGQARVYETLGGTPHLDGNYTIFGELISGLNVIDSIAAVPTRKEDDRPLNNVMIISTRLITRVK